MIALNKFANHCCSDNCSELCCDFYNDCNTIFEKWENKEFTKEISDNSMPINFLYEQLKIAERKKKLSKLLS